MLCGKSTWHVCANVESIVGHSGDDGRWHDLIGLDTARLASQTEPALSSENVQMLGSNEALRRTVETDEEDRRCRLGHGSPCGNVLTRHGYDSGSVTVLNSVPLLSVISATGCPPFKVAVALTAL